MKGKDRSEAGIERTFDEGGRREDRRNGGREGSLLGKSRRGRKQLGFGERGANLEEIGSESLFLSLFDSVDLF